MTVPCMMVTVDSKLACIHLAGRLVRTFCDLVGASHDETSAIEICVVEAANNSVMHAYSQEPGHPVEISVSHDGGLLSIEISDRGQAMNPAVRASSRRHLLDGQPVNLQDIPERGRGLAIIESVMDTMKYASSCGVNRFTMTKRLEHFQAAR